jgi:hypothetical protein
MAKGEKDGIDPNQKPGINKIRRDIEIGSLITVRRTELIEGPNDILFYVILAELKSLICMKRYIIASIISLALSVISFGQRGPQINIFPPQMHQQICQESTFARYLQIFNTGDSTLYYNAVISPDTISWMSVSPLTGQVQPGDTTGIEFDFNSAGLPLNNYYADLVVRSNDPKDSVIVVLTMLHVQVLTIVINPEQDSICLGCSTQLVTHAFGCSEAYSFSWASDPPGFSSFEKSPVVSPQITTTYTVTVTDGNFSDQKSVLIKVAGPSGMKEEQLVSAVSVYPNPCDEAFMIHFSSEYGGDGLISIIDLTGSIVLKSQVIVYKGLNELIISTGNLDPGAYLLSVKCDDKSRRSILISEKIFIR